MKQTVSKPAASAAAFLLALLPIGCAPGMFRVSGAESTILGDVNLDTSISVSDAVMLARCVAEDTACGIQPQGIENGDMDGDHLLSANDAAELVYYVAYGELKTKRQPEETTAVTTVTTVTETTATTTTTEVTVPQPHAELNVGGAVIETGTQLYEYIAAYGAPTEQFTMQYQKNTITYAIYAEDPAATCILIAADDEIAGCYASCGSYTAPADFSVTEYKDTHPTKGDGALYAVLALRSDVSISVYELVNQSDLYSFAKLNFYATNALRARRGIGTLLWDESGASIARWLAHDNGVQQKLSHEGSDGSTTESRLDAAGIDWKSYGENIGEGHLNPFGSLYGWLISTSGHRDVLLSPKYKYLGVGYSFDKYGENGWRLWDAQEFFTLFE